jgi:cytochrome P450
VLINDPLRSDGTLGANTFSILHLDPPLHALYRKLINREFTPRAALSFEDRIRATTRQVLDQATPGDTLNAVDAIAAPIPLRVIADLFGVGDANLDLLRRWSDSIIAAADLAGDERIEQRMALETNEIVMFLMEHISSPIADTNDVLGLLKRADLDGRPLDNAEIMGFCMTLLVAGNETTRSLISGGMEVLAQHPDQRAELAADPSLIPQAVEEMLRWVTPIQAFGRTAVVDVEIGGEVVSDGEFVVLLYASGNRDEAAFGPTADRFDIHRDVTPTHVAFGFGEHLCLGASLARLEAKIVFEELLARFPTWDVDGPTARSRSTLTSALTSLPVVLHAG